MCLPNTELQVAEVELLVKLHINENSFGLAAKDWLESDSLYFFFSYIIYLCQWYMFLIN